MGRKNYSFLSIMYIDEESVWSSRMICIYLEPRNEAGLIGLVRFIYTRSRCFVAIGFEGSMAARFVPASIQAENWML